MKTGPTTYIPAHFTAMPPPCETKTKRPRDTQVRTQGAPSLKKMKVREAIPEFIYNCPWPKQGTERKRARPPQDGGAAQAVEEDASTTAFTAMHALSDTVMPNLPRNITRNRETTLAPIPWPSLNLTTVTVSGETAVTDPTHLLPENPVLYAYPLLPAVPTHQLPCLASLPLVGSTTTSKPLNER